MNLLDLMVKIGVDDQASKQIGGIGANITKKLGSAVKTVGKIAAGGVAAAGAGAIAMTKAATESYAAYEQLAGGVAKLYGNAGMELDEYAKSVGKTTDEVEKDWQRNEDAQAAVMKHAMEGYRTSGMSMNQYMEQATSFSAALINSLGGDTAKAAEQTDVAMRAISDNVNTFGSDMGSVQMAFQGFAKQNYTMLDNLKLGYGGTKEEMQRLIDDANAWGEANGKASDLSIESFSDVVTAIEQIQEKQGIAGTTAKEAMSTIEGSVNATKAAWENLLAAFGSGDQEQIESAVTGIVDGIFGTFNKELGTREGGIINNLLPVVQRVGDAIVAQIPQLAESLAWNLIEVINDTFGTDFDAESIMTSIEGAFSTASERLGSVFDGLSSAWESFSSTFDAGTLTAALANVQSIGEQVWGFVEQNILPNMPAIGEAIGNVANFLGGLVETVTAVLDAIAPFVPAILGAVAGVKGFLALQGVIGFFTTLGTAVANLVTIVGTFGGPIAAVTAALGGLPVIIAGLVAAVVAFIATNEDAREAIVDAWNAVVDFFAGLPEWWNGVWESITKAVGEFVKSVAQKWTDLKAKAKQTWEGIKTAAVDAVLRMVSNVVGKFRGLVSTARDIWSNIKSTISNAINTAKETVVNAATRIYDGVKQKFQSVVDYVKGVPQAIKNALGNLGSILYGAGTSIIEGLWNGLKAKWESVKSWLSARAEQIKKLKGPLPYDRKVLVDNGVAVMYGFQKGLELGFDRNVAPYLKSIAGDVNSTMTFGASGTMQDRAIGGGDVYYVYLSVEGSDSDQMAVEFTEALRTRSMLEGRTSTIEVRRR